MSKHIKELIRQGENQQLDFKFAINDSRKIARTIAAFSNTDGGTLLIGVKDNGSIAGIQTDEEYYMIDSAAQLHCRPSVDFSFKKWTIDRKTILEVTIPKSASPPVMAQTEENQWKAYIRVGDQNFRANRIQLEVWRREKRKRGALIRYREAEETLITYLDVHGGISLTRFSKLAGISKKRAETILINMILARVLEIKMSEKGAIYVLRESEYP